MFSLYLCIYFLNIKVIYHKGNKFEVKLTYLAVTLLYPEHRKKLKKFIFYLNNDY